MAFEEIKSNPNILEINNICKIIGLSYPKKLALCAANFGLSCSAKTLERYHKEELGGMFDAAAKLPNQEQEEQEEIQLKGGFMSLEELEEHLQDLPTKERIQAKLLLIADNATSEFITKGGRLPTELIRSVLPFLK